MFQSDDTYATGEWKHMVEIPLVSDFPKSMRERLLKRVVEQFLEDLEAMQEITNNLE